MAGMMFPAHHRAVCEDLRIIARLRAARTALAIERFRGAAGRLPAALDELVSQHLKTVPEDPFDGKPLRYRKLGKGYVVYSVGTDGADNDGKRLGKKSRDGEETDVPFAVVR